ncbi:capsid cement protein [Mycobacterium sp. AT1]|uniref:capsid cement protein n=1 Tax=Mycobacterium sp. AT1 TaxID=1961706 RepID=UPI0009AC0FD3|nr:capsid cement protein [Mycobacterium sp. AT1]OPX11997.1 DUF2190 domain-containing protein [Mycobacterium sp. AT1]
MSTVITQPWVYAPGEAITASATAPVTVRRIVRVSGNRDANGNIAVAPAGTGVVALGVAANDAATGQLVRVARGGVVRVMAEASITAGAAVQVGAAAGVVTASTGTVIGHAVTGVAAGAVAEIAWPA